MFFGFELLADIKYAFIVRRGILDPARIAAALPSADRRALRGRRRPRLDHVLKVDGKEIANHPSHTIPFLLTFDEIATAHAQQTTGTPGSPSATARSVPSECARVQPEFMTDDQGYGIPSRQERSRARRRIKKAMQADTLQELIAWLRANPDKASQGTAGAGSTSHLSGIFFQMETGTRYQFVPYRNTGMQDLMAGLIDLMIDPAAFCAASSKPAR